MGDLQSVAITPFSTMGAGGPRLSLKNSRFNTVRSRIGIKTSETAAKRYGVATLAVYVQQRTPAAETRSARKRRLDKNEKAAQYAAKKAASTGRCY